MRNSFDNPQASVLAIGGMNIDILGYADSVFTLGDSLSGKVELCAGGVAHNIARHLARNRVSVQLLTALGSDLFSSFLQESCRVNGIGLDLAIHFQVATPTYLAIHNQQGDMVCAINHTDALAMLTPELIKDKLHSLLEPYSACVVDANLSSDSLISVFNSLSIPIIADPVSAVKCHRLAPVLHRLYAIKPNHMEAKALTGLENPASAASSLIEKGVQQVYISLGSDGVFFADKHCSGYLAAPLLPSVGVTGAGDAMTAGIILGILQGWDAKRTVASGIEMSYQYLYNKQIKQSEENT
jgi:pseudouridine kinase